MSRFNIQRVSASVLIDVSEDDDLGVSSAVTLNGLLRGVLVNAPDLDDTDTYTVRIKDADSYTVFSKASLAENTKTATYIDANNHPLALPLSGTHTIEVLASGGQAADRTFTVSLLVDRG